MTAAGGHGGATRPTEMGRDHERNDQAETPGTSGMISVVSACLDSGPNFESASGGSTPPGTTHCSCSFASHDSPPNRRWGKDDEIMRLGVDSVSWRGARFKAVLFPAGPEHANAQSKHDLPAQPTKQQPWLLRRRERQAGTAPPRCQPVLVGYRWNVRRAGRLVKPETSRARRVIV
jgi:hypothetical protein